MSVLYLIAGTAMAILQCYTVNILLKVILLLTIQAMDNNSYSAMVTLQ